MKDKIMFLIIGILIGAIIATSSFFLYNKSISNKNLGQGAMIGTNGQMGEPPAKPDENDEGQPPTKPENSNN